MHVNYINVCVNIFINVACRDIVGMDDIIVHTLEYCNIGTWM